jgi:polyketide cyclase/dehydrase/lipid transport protein
MLTRESSVLINRPVQDVFAFVSDATNDPQWHTDVVEASRVSGDGSVGVGTTVRWVLSFMGRKEALMEVTRYEPDRLVELRARSGPMTPTLTYRFEVVDGATRFTRVVEPHPEGVYRLLTPLLGGMIAQRNRGYLDNLRRVLEGD